MKFFQTNKIKPYSKEDVDFSKLEDKTMFDKETVYEIYKKKFEAKEKFLNEAPHIIGQFMDFYFTGKKDKEQYAKDVKFIQEAEKELSSLFGLFILDGAVYKCNYADLVVDAVVTAINDRRDCAYVDCLTKPVVEALEERGFTVSKDNVIIWG